jgi:RNA polymerase sigma-70 factor (ECF subfamily)
MDETDAELVNSVRRGDRRAAGRLLQRYLRAGRAVALAVTGVEADADDVCQDAFIVAIERIDDCRDPAKFGKWLLQIVRNRARNLVRADSGRRLVALGDTTPAADSSPATRVERAELRERLLGALAQIPEQHREVVLLHDLEGWKHREIAERLGLPEGTVRSHLHHARRRLRRILKDGGTTDE